MSSDLPAADITITIRARVPLMFVPDMFEAARRNTPQDGILMIEIDGSAE